MRIFERIPRHSKPWVAPAAWFGSLTVIAVGWFATAPLVFWTCVLVGSAFPVYRVTRLLAPKAWPVFGRGLSMVWRLGKALLRFPYVILVMAVTAPVAVARRFRRPNPGEKNLTKQLPMPLSVEALSPHTNTRVPLKSMELIQAEDSSVGLSSERHSRPSKNTKWKICVVSTILVAPAIAFFVPQLITVLAAVAIVVSVFKFTCWVIRENREQLKIFSFGHLLLTCLKFPLYALPGVLIFFAAAFPLLFVDAIVGAIINALVSAAGSAGGVVDGYINSPPSVWAVPEYVVWRVVSWVIPPTAVSDGSLIMSGIVNWIITLSSLLTLLTLAALIIAMIIAMIRFLIEIWGRCLLASRGAEVSFRLDHDPESSRPMSQRFHPTTSVREVVLIPRGTGFYSTTKLRPHGPKGHGAIPYMLTCPIARFRWGLYRLRCYRAADKDENLTYTGGSGAHFIQVHVADGERLCVDLAYLVGFSESVRLKVRWTSRLSAMLLGRIGYVLASGPGTIVMKASGPPEVLMDIEHTAGTNQHFDATCLIAWEPSSQFAIGASGKLLDVYLEPAFLYVQTSPLTLLNPGDSQHFGIFAKLKNWLIQSVVPV